MNNSSAAAFDKIANFKQTHVEMTERAGLVSELDTVCFSDKLSVNNGVAWKRVRNLELSCHEGLAFSSFNNVRVWRSKHLFNAASNAQRTGLSNCVGSVILS